MREIPEDISGVERLLWHVRGDRRKEMVNYLLMAQDMGVGVQVKPTLTANQRQAKRIVREGMSDVLAWLGEPVIANDDDEFPVFYEVEAPLLGANSALGNLCSVVNDAITEELHRFGLRLPSGLRGGITTGAMMAGNFDQAVAYLLRWVNVAIED